MSPQTIEEDIKIDNGASGLAAKLCIASSSAPLVVFVHGFAGNKDENGLFQDAKVFFSGKGFSVLRFDFRGCGDSPGSFRQVRLGDLRTDLKSVFRYVGENDSIQPCSVALVGFSLGAAVSILVNPKLPKSHVYWSPAIFTANDMYPRYQTREVLDQIKEKGFFVKSGLEVGVDFMNDLLQNEIEFSIRNVKARVLLIHGGRDSRIPPSSSRQAKKLFKLAEVRLLPDADHSFRDIRRERLFSTTINWLWSSAPRVPAESRSQVKAEIAPRSCELISSTVAP